jgi:hypothetical protein
MCSSELSFNVSIFPIDIYDQLKKNILTFFHFSNEESFSKDNTLLSHGQQQMLNIQETFFKSNKNFLLFVSILF